MLMIRKLTTDVHDHDLADDYAVEDHNRDDVDDHGGMVEMVMVLMVR